MNFLLAWMGSFIFWIVYIVMSFIIGGFMIRQFAPSTWEFMKTGERPYKRNSYSRVSRDDIAYVMIGWYLLWWIVLPLVIIWKMGKLIMRFIKDICFPWFVKVSVKSMENIPEIEIRRKEQ